MTRTLLVLAASLLVAPAAWAMDAPIQEGGGNNVGHAIATPAPAPAPGPAPSTDANMSHAAFNPNAYGSASECMTAAAAAHQALGPCEALPK